jgi:hypothetical protein
VIKSLDTHYRSVEGVAGATILGDGRVALIIDVDGLVARSLSASAGASAGGRMNIAAAFEPSMPGISPGIYDNDDFTAISEIAHREAGLVLPPGKAMLVYSRLAPWCGIRLRHVRLLCHAHPRGQRGTVARDLRPHHQPRSSIAKRIISSILRRNCGRTS